jgi:hypothetical protein
MFKPFHDITTQAVRASAAADAVVNCNTLSKVDADGNVLEGLYDKNGIYATEFETENRH